MKKISILSITIIGTLLSFSTVHTAQKISAQAHKPLIQSNKSGPLVKIQPISKNNKAETLVHERTLKPMKIKEIETIEFQ